VARTRKNQKHRSVANIDNSQETGGSEQGDDESVLERISQMAQDHPGTAIGAGFALIAGAVAGLVFPFLKSAGPSKVEATSPPAKSTRTANRKTSKRGKTKSTNSAAKASTKVTAPAPRTPALASKTKVKASNAGSTHMNHPEAQTQPHRELGSKGATRGSRVPEGPPKTQPVRRRPVHHLSKRSRPNLRVASKVVKQGGARSGHLSRYSSARAEMKHVLGRGRTTRLSAYARGKATDAQRRLVKDYQCKVFYVCEREQQPVT
jgi:hypothetical protein